LYRRSGSKKSTDTQKKREEKRMHKGGWEPDVQRDQKFTRRKAKRTKTGAYLREKGQGGNIAIGLHLALETHVSIV